ncbi:MAG: PIN domain-containing protein [Caldimonas sp.]
MVVVDSSVWIDYFSGAPNPARDVLRRVLADSEVRVVVPDLVLFEVLRGFRTEQGLRQARTLMESLSIESTGGRELALAAVDHYRSLRAHGVTVGGAVDAIVATFCIERGYLLLHRDGDFDSFEQFRGLRVWRH